MTPDAADLAGQRSFWEQSFDRLDDYLLRQRLEDRRQKLRRGMQTVKQREPLLQLLREVDDALERMNSGAYGLCDVCHEPIEPARLMADPLLRNCLDHLSPTQQRALEEDLDTAWRIQRELLPDPDVRWDGWEVSHHYAPAGAVSGDYCDLLKTGAGELYFLLGDVSGKGIAASMLMSHLHAMFRSLVAVGLPFSQLMDRANRLFCDSTASNFFATLVLGKTSNAGGVQICNAGHCPVVWVRPHKVTTIESTGIPLGVFAGTTYELTSLDLQQGESLVLYTDGLTEACNGSDQEYGTDRIVDLMGTQKTASAREAIDACLGDLSAFQAGSPRTDDLAIMVIRRL